MAKKIAVGIDIGTYQIKVVVSESAGHNMEYPKILGTGFAESKGLRHGYIITPKDATKSIRQAIDQAERNSNTRISRAFISVGGIGLQSTVSTGSIMVSRGDSEIDELDINKLHEICEKEIPSTTIVNRKIINSIPLQYKLDGKVVLGNSPIGLRGNKLECKMIFITCLEHHIHSLIETVEDAGVEVIDVMASPMASSLVILNKSQKIAGCALVNIGSETLSLVIFDENKPRSLEVFPVGSNNITNDIALAFKISLDEAEHMKIGGITTFNFPRKKLEDVINARLEDMFELIQTHIKKNNPGQILPAGIIFTGGGANIASIEEVAKISLALPAKVGTIHTEDPTKSPFKDSSWSIAYGLCIWGLSTDDNGSVRVRKMFVEIRKKIIVFIKQFLP